MNDEILKRIREHEGNIEEKPILPNWFKYIIFFVSGCIATMVVFANSPDQKQRAERMITFDGYKRR
jgi:hypothetical protein